MGGGNVSLVRIGKQEKPDTPKTKSTHQSVVFYLVLLAKARKEELAPLIHNTFLDSVDVKIQVVNGGATPWLVLLVAAGLGLFHRPSVGLLVLFCLCSSSKLSVGVGAVSSLPSDKLATRT